MSRRILEQQEIELKQKKEILSVKEKAEKSSGDPNEVIELLDRLDKNFEGVNSTEVARADAETFAELGAKAKQNIERDIKNNRRLDSKTFVAKLKRKYQSGSETNVNWAKLGRDCNKYFYDIPNNNFLFGTMSIEPVTKAPRKRRQNTLKQALSNPSEKPQLIDKQDAEAAAKKDRSTYMQGKISSILQKKVKGKIPLFKLVLNPNSFTQTVENLFHYSFLVKDASRVTVGESGEAEAESCNFVGHDRTSQSILSLSFADFEKLKEIYGDDRSLPIIPNRTDSVYEGTT